MSLDAALVFLSTTPDFDHLTPKTVAALNQLRLETEDEELRVKISDLVFRLCILPTESRQFNLLHEEPC